jgi:acetone carboxylase gamma subunit
MDNAAEVSNIIPVPDHWRIMLPAPHELTRCPNPRCGWTFITVHPEPDGDGETGKWKAYRANFCPCCGERL